MSSSFPRRSTMLALLAMVVALTLPGHAFAAWSTNDPDSDTDTSEPAGYGSAPDQPQGTGSSSCTWNVKGRLYVRNPTLDGVADGEPLAGVEIKVSGADSAGSTVNAFGKWDTTYTNADGEFSVTHSECRQRRVRVEAKFESASRDLRVLGPSSPEWYVIKDTNALQDARTIDLKGEPFAGETGDQATGQARTDAQTWILYRKAIDYVSSLGRPFLNDVTVHNPASLHAGSDNSWTDPVLHGIHIAPDNTNSRWNMLHELGHAWAYPREKAEDDCLIEGAFGKDNTHSASEARCVAFNEGFANFFASKLDEEMSAAGIISPSDPSWSGPYSRAHLVSEGLLSLNDAEHSEYGFEQAFRVLTQADIATELFGDGTGPGTWVSEYTGSDCASPAAPSGLDGLDTALKVIGTADDQFDIRDNDSPTMAQLFDRADERLTKFDEWDASYYEQLVDPASDVEPHQLYAC